jgi:FKBP-type peptidyl-prolyl cis-trans isomerase FkpA
MKRKLTFAIGLVAIFTMTFCDSKYPGFEQTETGLYYKIHKQNENAQKPEMEDIVYLRMYNYLENSDSVITDLRDTKRPQGIRLMEPMYNGDINEGIAMLGVGDSATFIVNAGNFFKYNVRMPQIPKGIDSTENIVMNVSIESIKTKAEFEKERQTMMEEREKMLKEQKETEETKIEKYLKENRIYSKPTASGLYFISKKKGKGKKAKPGLVVKVNYTGRLLDGRIFDSSIEEDAKEAGINRPEFKPIEFVLGKGQVITGWDEGIAKMREGGKAKLVIPSHLAYAGRGAGAMIPPYTPLTFDVELVEVLDK